MGVADRISERSVGDARTRARAEVDALLGAAFTVLRRDGIDHLTVAEVLAAAELSTRAFYRHFAGKDELVLALFAHESERATAKRRARLADAADPRDALDRWIDDVLALAFEPRRAARTRVLQAEGTRLQREFPAEFARILADELAPLVEILAAGRRSGVFPTAEPDVDARTIHAVVWSLVQSRLDGHDGDLADVRRHVDRFVLPALTGRSA